MLVYQRVHESDLVVCVGSSWWTGTQPTTKHRSKRPSWAVVSWQGAPWFNMSKQFSPKSSIKLTWAYKYIWKPKQGSNNYAGPDMANLINRQSGSLLHSRRICQNLPVRSLFHRFFAFLPEWQSQFAQRYPKKYRLLLVRRWNLCMAIGDLG